MKIFYRNFEKANGLRDRLDALPSVIKWGALAVAALSLVFAGWLGIQGLKAKSELEQARANAETAKDALLSGETENATRAAENAQFHARQARAATHSLPWTILSTVPLIGSPLKTTQQISDVVVGLADDVLLPATKVGAVLTPDKIVSDGAVNLQLLRSEEPALSELSAAAARLDAEAQSISRPAYVSVIKDARSQLQTQTSGLADLLGNTAIAARLAPSMLGADGPRTYLVVFQNNAEARGTGGLIGGFGILVFRNGKPSVPGLAPNNWFGGQATGIDLGAEFDTNFGWANAYSDARNSNLSSHFPHAAQIWKAIWDESLSPVDQPVDGVIALDPVALSYLLGAIGPVTAPDGEVVTQDNVVQLLASTAYAKFPEEEDQDARKKYLQGIIEEVVKRATVGAVDSPRDLLDALGKAVSERRISVWSADPAEQELIEKTPLAHIIPQDQAPYAEVVVNNLAGNKMDYYLRREIEYVADGCDGDMRNSTITVRLENTAPDGLPERVGASEGIDGLPLNVANGTMVTSVRVIATSGARLLSVTANGERTTAVIRRERGHPSFEVQIAIPRGQGAELVFQLTEPTAPGAPRVPVQPLIDEPEVTVSVPTCPGRS